MVKYSILIAVVVASHLCVAQKAGYNYQPPPGNTGTIQQGSSIRPGYPSPAPVTGGFPSGPTATQPPFGGFGGGGGGFPARPGPQADTPTGPGFPAPGGFPGSSPGIAAGRPTAPGRPGAAGFPGVGGRPTGPAPTQFGQQTGGRPSAPGQFGQTTGIGNNDGSYEGGDYSAIPGQPGVDYPIYTEIPQTSFDCNQQQYPGYYADVEAQCQVFHVCALNRTYDFLCPNGTIFSQETLVCVWWNQFDCASAPAFYPNNAFIYDYSQTGQNSQQGGSSVSFPGSTTPITNRPSNNAFQPRPTGTGVGNFPGTGRPSGPGTFTQPGPAAGYPGQAQTPQTVGFPSAGGFPSTGVPSGPGFPSAPGPSGPSGPNVIGGFGTTVRPGIATIQGDSQFPATITPASVNREYLPPRRV